MVESIDSLMPLKDLDETERQIVRECLKASATGPFFPMWEFHTLFGLEHQEVSDIAFGKNKLDDSHEDVGIAINNSLNNLTGYPHKCGKDVWDRFISVPPREVRRIYTKWKVGASANGVAK